MFRKLILLFLGAIFITIGCKKSDKSPNPANAGADDCIEGAAVTSGDIISGKYIILYKNSPVVNEGMSAQRQADFGREALSRNNISTTVIEKSFGGDRAGFVASLSSNEAERLSQDDAIEAIEPDRIVSLSTCFTVVAPRLVTWNIERVGYGDGTGKKIWIIDTGIDFEHPDLNDDQARSRSFISGQSSAKDENGHGTHVAGIIGAKNNTFGVLGVASGATLISLRVLDRDGDGALSNIIQALAYINANASAGDVVNMSVGNDNGVSDILDQQVKNTASKGILFAIAAGNEHEAANKYSPGRANGSNIFTVSAVDSLGNFASFSNYGNDVVDFAAPGVRILSTYMSNKYAYMSGTSMAAPHLAGLLALKGRNINSLGSARNDPDGSPDAIAHY
jgi:subtilisin